MLSACIIDDKITNNQTLSQLLAAYCPQVAVTGTATNIRDGFTLISNLKPSVVFLDIEMSGGTGFELMDRFNPVPFEVILVTAYDQYAVRAFKENAVAYLLKPIDIDELKEAVAKVEKQLELKQAYQITSRHIRQIAGALPSKISIPVLDGYIFVNSEEIIRCEGAGSYSWFHMIDGKKIMVSLRLKECEAIFPEHTFFRAHKSHIVNVKYIARYTRGRGGYMELQDGSIVEVAPQKKDAFLELMRAHRKN